MRRFLYTAALMMVLLPCVHAQKPILAGRRTKSFTDKVTGGSLVWTNTLDHVAYELKHIMFTLPATTTNTLTIAHDRIFKLPDTAGTTIYTNEVDSTDISTNYYRYSNSTAQFTNSVVVANTTNLTINVYDGSDFGYGWTFEPNDVSTFTFTYTNTIYLTRVYDEYIRP